MHINFPYLFATFGMFQDPGNMNIYILIVRLIDLIIHFNFSIAVLMDITGEFELF